MPEYVVDNTTASIGVTADKLAYDSQAINGGQSWFDTLQNWATNSILRVGDYYVNDLVGANPPPQTRVQPPQVVRVNLPQDSTSRLLLYAGVALGAIGLVAALRKG